MIFAQLHTGDGGLSYGIASRLDQPDQTWLPFDVPDYTWLYLDANNNIQQFTATQHSELSEEAEQALYPTLKERAQTALVYVNKVAQACIMNKITFPAEWQAYYLALQDIVAGKSAQAIVLDSQPPLPSGLVL